MRLTVCGRLEMLTARSPAEGLMHHQHFAMARHDLHVIAGPYGK